MISEMDWSTRHLQQLAAEILRALEQVAVDQDAGPMKAYMQNRFEYLGVKAGPRRLAQRQALKRLAGVDGDSLTEFAQICWQFPYREMQYVATDALRKHNGALHARHLATVEGLIIDKSWWDTVDSLAAHTVGPLVRRHPDLVATFDQWIAHDNIWLARTAIIYQLSYKEHTDATRLFGYASQRATDEEFFIRKAIGWALRQYARTDPDAVRQYVAQHDSQLSALSKREALKHLR